MLHSYPPDLTTVATPLGRSSQRALLAVNNSLTFLRELSALCLPCLTAFIPAPISVAFSLHLLKHSFLPPPPPHLSVCFWLILLLGMRHCHPPKDTTPFQRAPCNPGSHPKVTTAGLGKGGRGGTMQIFRFKCSFIWVKCFIQQGQEPSVIFPLAQDAFGSVRAWLWSRKNWVFFDSSSVWGLLEVKIIEKDWTLSFRFSLWSMATFKVLVRFSSILTILLVLRFNLFPFFWSQQLTVA